MIELLLPCGFDTREYSWVKATIGIYMLADYSVTNCQSVCQNPIAQACTDTHPASAVSEPRFLVPDAASQLSDAAF
jgi:hypothetical protein